MARSKQKYRSKHQRRFSFTGNTASDSIVIGNHGNASLSVKGQFNLSGILYCLAGKVEFRINGNGQISFFGKCRSLVIKECEGDCILDLGEVKCDIVTIESLKGQATIILGDTRRVDITQMNEEATLRIRNNPLVTVHSLDQNARIICPKMFMPPVVVHPTNHMDATV